MKKRPGKKIKKMAAKLSKKVASKAKKVTKAAKKKTNIVKVKALSMLGKANKTLKNATHKIHATEEDVVRYVKRNPVKSIGAVALAGLIAGFLAHHKINE